MKNVLFAVLVVAGAIGCSNDVGDGPAAPTLQAQCALNTTRECVGPGACKGGQYCDENGAWSMCECTVPVVDAGAADAADESDGASVDTGSLEACSHVEFDGVDDYVVISKPALLAVQGSRTVEAWVKIAQNTGTDQSVFYKGGGCENAEFRFGLDKDLRLYAGFEGLGGSLGDDSEIKSSGSMPLGKWIHIAHTWNASSFTHTLYVNGASINTKNVAGVIPYADSSTDALIGAVMYDCSGGPKNMFAGEIAGLRVTAAVASSAFTPAFPLNNGLGTLGLWRFDEGHGSTLEDTSTSNQPGALIGGTWGNGCPSL